MSVEIRVIVEADMARAFNEWMRRYTDEPERFEREFETVGDFLATPDGETPTYGATCAAYLLQIRDELRASADAEKAGA